MLLHFLHNATLMTIAKFENQLAEWGIGTEQQAHLPMGLLLGSLVPILFGAILLYFTKKPGNNSHVQAEPLADR
jgi:hypothetical protein